MSEREAGDLAAAIRRMIRALVRRAGAGDVIALEELGKLEKQAGYYLGEGVRAFRAFEPAHNAEPFSWQAVADAIGTSRQNAYQRFGRET